MDDFQPDNQDDFQADDFQPDSAPQSNALFQRGMDAYNKYVEPATPVGLLKRADSAVRQGADWMGEKVAEFGGRQGYPNTGAAVGTAVSMAPDIAMTIAAPESELKQPTQPLFRSFSQPMARRALGFTKRFLNTPLARSKAAQAAEVALEENIIPFSGSATEALARATDLQKTSGEALGGMREAAGSSPLDPVFDSLETARQNATNGMRGGAWDTVHRKFDEAQETLMALLNKGPEVSLKSVEQAKKLLSKTVNWVADNVSQESAKQISRAIESGVEDIMRSKGIDMAGYESQKRLYGASKTMQKGLANEVAAQSGNNAISLPSAVIGAGQLATGNVPGAAATIGITEALRRRGAGFGARVVEEAGKRLPPKRLLKLAVPTRGLFSPNPTSGPSVVPVENMLSPQDESNGIAGGGNSHMEQPNNNWNEQQHKNANNSNSEGFPNHPAILSTAKPSNQGKKVLDEKNARKYLKRAEGNKDKARQFARADGWVLA